MRCLTKENHITLFTHDNQTGGTNHIINMLEAAHKGTTSPTLDQWHDFLLYLHRLMEELFNRQVNRVITVEMLEGQNLNKIGPSLTLFQ